MKNQPEKESKCGYRVNNLNDALIIVRSFFDE